MAADTTFRGDPSARSGPAPAWVVVVKWAAIALVVAFGTLISWRLVEQGHALFVVLIAFVVMAVVAVYATRANVSGIEMDVNYRPSLWSARKS